MGLKGRLAACWGVIVKMQDDEKLSLDQIQAFLEATQGVRFAGKERAEMYGWISRTLQRQQYREQGKGTRGLLRRYVGKMTGSSRTQMTRLVAQYMEQDEVKEAVNQRRRFASRYTRGDIELLAKVDEGHETLAGPATSAGVGRAGPGSIAERDSRSTASAGAA
ncbi:MAG: hypothetical protein EXQ52_14810 [Bryobacterales bacterium]|nr:hypothetical protein [Bryobacterales bacterium]